MAKFPIQLGSMGGPACCAPDSGCDSKCYPTLYIDGIDAELPAAGTMTVKFRLARESTDHKREKNSADIEVLEILSVKGEKADEEKHPRAEAEETLDKLRDEVED